MAIALPKRKYLVMAAATTLAVAALGVGISMYGEEDCAAQYRGYVEKFLGFADTESSVRVLQTIENALSIQRLA